MRGHGSAPAGAESRARARARRVRGALVTLAALSVLLALLLSPPAAPAQELLPRERWPGHGPPPPPSPAPFPAEGTRLEALFHRGAPFVHLEFDGRAGALPGHARRGLFLLDTGANVSGVDGAWLAASRLEAVTAGAAVVAGTTGSVSVRKVLVPAFALAGEAFPDLPLGVHDYSHFRTPTGEPEAGLIGTDVLARFRLALDVEGGHVSLARREERAAAAPDFVGVPLTFPSRIPTVVIGLGGVTLPARLDTGAMYADPRAIVDANEAALEALQAAGLALRETGAITVGGISGPERRRVYEVEAPLEIGPARIPGVALVIQRQGTLAKRKTPLALLPASTLARLTRYAVDPFERSFLVPR